MQKLLRRIAHGFYWRYNANVKPRLTHLRIMARWHLAPQGKPHTLPAKLIVSITSFPPRFGTLALALRSLLRQTVRPDQTVLWIAHEDMPLLPQNVLDLQSAGLTIYPTDDLRSYKKIIPALDRFPGAFICTADDDLYYWPTWLAELTEQASDEQRIVTCHRAHEIAIDEQSRFKPYSQWCFDVPYRGHSNHLFPTGIGGVLYPPSALVHKPSDRQAIFDLCPHADDIWLYWMVRRNGFNYKTAGRHRQLITLPQSQKQALWHDNLERGRNDEMIRKMAARYGYPDLRTAGNAFSAEVNRHPPAA
jgi:hypothetical protein